MLSGTISNKLDGFFALSERGTSIGTEFRAGTASFLTLSYLLLVNPQIMQQAGVSHDDAVFATALSSAISCYIVGICGNLPFACAPGLGLSAYLVFGLVVAGMCTLQEALTTCWLSGILVFLFAILGLAHWLMKIVPQSIKYGIVVGMGLLIAMIGLVSVGIIEANPKTLVELGDVWGDWSLLLCMAGILLIASLMYHDVKGGILIGIVTLTLLVWFIENSWPTAIFQSPKFHSYRLDLSAMLDVSKASVLYPAMGTFVLICIFDISGVIFGLATLGGIIDESSGEIPKSVWAFVASGAGTLVAAWLGSTPIIVCVEGASGIEGEGGRTGLTAVVTGTYFGISIILAPLFSAVPDTATAPVLVMVGVMMMGESAKIKWHQMNDALPAFLTIIFMPLTYSITNGMIFGILASIGMYFTTGQFFLNARQLHRSLSSDSSASSSCLHKNNYQSDIETTCSEESSKMLVMSTKTVEDETTITNTKYGSAAVPNPRDLFVS